MYYYYYNKPYPWEIALLLQQKRTKDIPYITYSKRYKKYYAYSIYTNKIKNFINNPNEEKINQYLKEIE